MMCIPKSNHKKLIDECYPPPKSLGSIGPEYKPNGNELSRLAYYGNRKPIKLTKVGHVLEQKASQAAKSVSGSGQASDKAKGSLMVTLGIVKELIVECRRDINYFSSSAASVIKTALQAATRGSVQGQRDLDITSRSAATFYALANHLDSSSSSLDTDTSRQYMELLRSFARIAVDQSQDNDVQARTRQAGLGALAGAIGSDLFYSSTYSEQLSEIVPALLVNIDANKFASNSELRSEADKITDSSEASNAEYAAKRRIASARTVPAFSVDAEKPLPDNATSSAAMGSLFTLVHHGDASHVQGFVGALLDFLNGKTSNARHWEHKDWCCWIVQSVCSWTNLQYRFIIPTTLVDYLVDDSNSPTENKHHTLIAMIASVLGGKLSIIGLSTSDTANSLLGFAVRRVHNDSKDPVLPPLVKCIAALGTHIYYADQLNDLAEEITARIASLEIPDATEQDANPVPYTERKSARESIRMLLACLLRLMDTAQKSSGEVQKGWERKDKSLSVQGAGTRSRISTSVWHQTTSLLASPDYAVRYSLEEVLSAFFKTEAQPSSLDSNDPLSDTLGSKLSVEATGFTHSFSAALYVLTLSKVLYAPNTAKDSPLEALPAIDRSNKERQLELSSPSATALPIDFSALIQILDGMYERIPVAAILGTVPALLAINKSAANVPAGPRRDAIDTLVQSSLNKIASVAGISSLSSSVSNNLPTFPNADKPETFDDLASSHPAKSGNVKADSVISSLSNSSKLQAATDLDSKALQNWFARDWSVQIAVDDSFVGASPFKLVDDDASLPVNATPRNSERGGVVTNVLGASPSKSNGAGFGVDEFRQALGTRSANKANQNKTEYNSLNGGLSLPETALDKRASRRASRKISQPIKSSSNGNASPHSVGGLLDSMRVGLPEEDTDSSPQGRVAVPYAP